MTFDAQLPQNPAFETSVARPLLATLTRWWAPAVTAAADPELGYESALPWTLVVDDLPGDSGPTRY